MTTPGGVPNLPLGALTLDTLASKTQDMSTPAMKSRAAERFPTIFNSSTGLDPSLDITPFGILTSIFSGFNSQVANADPADVEGPEDLPGLLLQFIEGLPVIGQFVDLLDAILGTYTGDDATLLTVQAIFAPIRAIVDALTAVAGGTGGLTNFFPDLLGLLGNPTGLGSGTTGVGSLGSIPILGPVLGLFGGATDATQATNFFTNLLSFLGTPTLTGSTGTFDPTAAATSFINDILNPTGLLTSVTAIVEALTGTSGDLTDLTAWATDIPIIGDIVNAITGTTGGLTDLSDFFDLSGADNLLSGLINGVVGGTGNPLSALVSSLTGTASTASTADTNASTALGNWSTLLAGLPSITTISGLISWLNPGTASNGIFAPLINGVAGGSTNPLSSLISSLTGTASTASTAGTNASSALSTTGSMIDDLFNGISNLIGSGRSQAEMADAVAAQSNTVVGTSATTAQILAALGSGNPDADDFERTSSSNLGANWTIYQTGTGTLATPNGHDAAFTGSADATFVARKENKDAAGDNQIVSIVLSTSAEAAGDTIFIPTEYGQNDLWCRMTTFSSYATRTGVRLRFGANKNVVLSWFNSGTETVLASTTIANKPAAGATLELQAGVGLTVRRFVGKLNGTPVIDFTEAGTTSQFGATYRRRGFGGETQHAIIVTAHPGGVKQWTTQG